MYKGKSAKWKIVKDKCKTEEEEYNYEARLFTARHIIDSSYVRADFFKLIDGKLVVVIYGAGVNFLSGYHIFNKLWDNCKLVFRYSY